MCHIHNLLFLLFGIIIQFLIALYLFILIKYRRWIQKLKSICNNVVVLPTWPGIVILRLAWRERINF